MLTQRRKRVLDALINEYIAYATPVASKTLVERYGLDVSSATVRSELATLEAGGYVESPHTSSGRIPTDIGYRVFVDGLLASEAPTEDGFDASELIDAADSADSLFRLTCSLLMRTTSCLAVIMAPRTVQDTIRRFSLVSLGARRVLVVLITANGQVLNRRMEFAYDVEPARLAHIERLFNTVFSGHTADELEQVSQHDLLESAHDVAAVEILATVIDIVESVNIDRLYHIGMPALLSQPEFRDAHEVAALVSMVENSVSLISLFSDIAYGTKPTVRIGHENEGSVPDSMSLVAQEYTTGGAQGVVAVVGPTRMDYAHAISAVMRVSQVFKEVL